MANKPIIRDSESTIVMDWSGNKADTKPTKYGRRNLGVGCWYLEEDSKDVYYYNGTTWLFMYNMEG